MSLPVAQPTHLDAQFLERLRCQQCSDLRDNRSVETADDDLVAFVQDTVGEDDVERRSEALDDLDLQDGTVELGDVHELAAHSLLRELDDEHEHVWDTLTRVGRGGNQRDKL